MDTAKAFGSVWQKWWSLSQLCLLLQNLQLALLPCRLILEHIATFCLSYTFGKTRWVILCCTSGHIDNGFTGPWCHALCFYAVCVILLTHRRHWFWTQQFKCFFIDFFFFFETRRLWELSFWKKTARTTAPEPVSSMCMWSQPYRCICNYLVHHCTVPHVDRVCFYLHLF